VNQPEPSRVLSQNIVYFVIIQKAYFQRFWTWKWIHPKKSKFCHHLLDLMSLQICNETQLWYFI